jgi:hypothetical protein
MFNIISRLLCNVWVEIEENFKDFQGTALSMALLY